jgi:acetyl esterase
MDTRKTASGVLRAFFLLVALAAGVRANRGPANEYVYKNTPDRALKVYLTYPVDWSRSDNRSALVYFHNGGWKPETVSRQFREQATYFAARGMVVARADYREKDRSGVTSEKCIEDILSAVRWLRKNADMLGIDQKRIVAAGGSGSGHLAASGFYVDELTAPDDDLSISPRPGALMLFNPDLDVIKPHIMQRMLGGTTPARNMPPTLAFYGSEDVSHTLIADFVARARNLGMPVEAFVAEGATHGFFKFSPWLEKTTLGADEFLQSADLLEPGAGVSPPSKAKPKGYDQNVQKSMLRWQARHETLKKAREQMDDSPTVPTAPAAPKRVEQSAAAQKLAEIFRRFPEADTDKDGVLTMAEAKAFRDRMKSSKDRKAGKPAAVTGQTATKLKTDARNPSNATAVETHVYKTVGERKLIVEVRYPDDWSAEDNRPAILLFHGNTFNPRNKAGQLYPMVDERARLGLPVPENTLGQAFSAQAEYFARRGMVTFRVEHRRRSTDGVMPDKSIQDALSAMRWVRKNARMLGVDPDRIVSAGGSGGGCLAASVACIEQFQSPADDLSISPRPNAMLLYYPLLDWLAECKKSESFMEAVGGDREYAARISPARHWSKDAPPTLILIGTRDPMFESIRAFVARWKELGAAIEMYIGEGGSHGFSNYSPWLEKTTSAADEFLQSLGYLQGRPGDVALPARQRPAKKSAGPPAAPVAARSAPVPGRDTQDASKRGDAKPKKPLDTQQKAPAVAASCRNVTYGPHERNKLDIWLAESDRPTPVLIYFHGGSFKAGDKSNVLKRPIFDACLKAGISVVSANYRFSTDAPFPAPMLDGARAVQFIRHRARQWNLDADRIALSGGSAGGTMALWIALHDDLANGQSDDPVLRTSTRVSCVVCYAGPASMAPEYLAKHAGSKNPGAAIAQLFGVKKKGELAEPKIEKLLAEAAPINHVSADDPPLWLTYRGRTSDAPFTEDAPQKMWIHHVCLGMPLKKIYDQLALECLIHDQENPATSGSEMEFLIRVLTTPDRKKQ